MKNSLYTLTYAAVMGIVCSILLTGAGWFTKPYRDANAKAEKVRNILSVLGVEYEAGSSPKTLLEIFDKNVRVDEREDLELFVYNDPVEQKTLAVAIPFSGAGLWGPIKGFLSLEPDMTTIRGIAFHEQEETPGLGGEISADWFRDMFKGKRIESADGKPGIRIVRGGGTSAQNEVDGITGATMTCDKVEAMLNATIARIVKERGKDGR
ncbi:MAG: FMN-binding protein [Phycisphaerae bacterium]|jgi:Na+-transporting NADH:ubiquinone oxidoreductase subunit C|nr:FMN-binding protein [Phycisphaerae bacterium]